MRARPSFLICLVPLALACADGKSVVSVTVTASPAVGAADHLTVRVTDNSHTPPRAADPFVVALPGRPVSIPPDQHFAIVLPKDVRGSVHIAVDVQDGAGALIISGAVDVLVAPSRTVSATVALGTSVTAPDLAVVMTSTDLAGLDLAGVDLAAPLDGALAGGTRTAVRVDRRPTKMDVLFMIDNSPSMAPKQATLRASLPSFVGALQGLAGAGSPVSFHIGVITSDLGAAQTTIGNQCKPGGDGALLQLIGAGHAADCAPLAGPERYIDFNEIAGTNNLPSFVDADGGVTPQSLEKTIECLISVGDVGCGFEHQLESMYQALGSSVAGNAGFQRSDALLSIVLLTDEDDCSAPPDSDLFDAAKTAIYGTQASYRCTNYGVMCGAPPALMPYGSSGGGLTMCQSATTAAGGKLFEVDRYIQLLTRPAAQGGLKPNPADVIAAAITAPPVPVSSVVGNPLTSGNGLIPDTGCAINGSNCTVLLQHSCVGSNPMIVGDPAVRIAQVINSVGNHQQTSICSDDFSTAAKGVGDLIAAQFGPACLPAPLRNPGAPDCAVDDVKDNGDGTFTPTALPQCSGAARPCWKLVTNAACPGRLDSLGQMEQLTLVVDRGGAADPPGVVPSAACALAP